MITELRAESQITLPRTMIEKMGLAVGDLLDISERDGGVFIVPVAASHVFDRLTEEDSEKARKKQILMELCGSMNDPTFVEPPEITYESPREPIL